MVNTGKQMLILYIKKNIDFIMQENKTVNSRYKFGGIEKHKNTYADVLYLLKLLVQISVTSLGS